jgi:hypothetical protein
MTKSRGIREHHGMGGTKIYGVWWDMRNRCENRNRKYYPDYGGRGITVCAEWKKFSAFYRDMGDAPEGCTLERIDNDKGYSAGNCRWATRSEQAQNRRSSLLVTIGEETLSLASWVEKHEIAYATVHKRIKRGWDPHLALTTPARPLTDRRAAQ